jgi:Ca-activated chloride channel family protein
VANVGQTEAQALLEEVAQDRKQAITLTCVGVGYGAYNDALLEALAVQGDGQYVFLDSSEPSQEALVGQLAASMQNVAQDARIQVQFNPARVRRYRLIGYENRDIEDRRFRDDTISAGAVGSGQCSTALYELELMAPGVEGVSPSNRGRDGVPNAEFRVEGPHARDTDEGDLGRVFVRYRNADTGQMEEVSRPLANSIIQRRSVEEDPRFFLAAGAARFAEWLRQSEHAEQTTLADVQNLLDQVSTALPLDRDVKDLATLAHLAEGLPRTPQAQ